MCSCSKVRVMEMSLVQGVLDLQVLVCHLPSGGLFQVCSFETLDIRSNVEPRLLLTVVGALLRPLTIAGDFNSSFGFMSSKVCDLDTSPHFSGPRVPHL